MRTWLRLARTILLGSLLALAGFGVRAEDAPPAPTVPPPQPDPEAAKTPEAPPKDPAPPKAEAPKVDKDALKKEMDGLRAQMRDLGPKIENAKRKLAQSTDLALAFKAIGDARKALDDKLNAKVATDADGGRGT